MTVAPRSAAQAATSSSSHTTATGSGAQARHDVCRHGADEPIRFGFGEDPTEASLGLVEGLDGYQDDLGPEAHVRVGRVRRAYALDTDDSVRVTRRARRGAGRSLLA